MSEHNDLLTAVVEHELAMFLAVQNEGGPASCQQQPDVFRAMRRKNHAPRSTAMLASYLRDLQLAEAQGRNLMTEKYARMDNLIPPLSTNPLIDVIVKAETDALLAAARNNPDSIRLVSNGQAFARYLRCELETMSDETLRLYSQELGRG